MVKPAQTHGDANERNDCRSPANCDWFEFGANLGNIAHFATAKNSFNKKFMSSIDALWGKLIFQSGVHLRFSNETPRGWTLDNIKFQQKINSYWKNNQPEEILVCKCF